MSHASPPPESPDAPGASDIVGDAAADHDSRNDHELLKAHVAGDPKAFARLVDRHANRLWAIALRTAGNPEEAADALQDAYLSAFRRADSFRGEAQVTTWLHRIVVNACLDRIRRSKPGRTVPLPDDDHEQASRLVFDQCADPVEAEELRTDVLGALRTLNPDQRAALVLVDMEGYSVEEAASILGCPVGTVKSRCARGRARLVPLLRHLRLTAETDHAGTA